VRKSKDDGVAVDLVDGAAAGRRLSPERLVEDAGSSGGAGRRRRPGGGTAARGGARREQVLGLLVLAATCYSGGDGRISIPLSLL
jgi:hypothetical protein